MSSDISKQSNGSPASCSRLAMVKPEQPAPMMQVEGLCAESVVETIPGTIATAGWPLSAERGPGMLA